MRLCLRVYMDTERYEGEEGDPCNQDDHLNPINDIEAKQ